MTGGDGSTRTRTDDTNVASGTPTVEVVVMTGVGGGRLEPSEEVGEGRGGSTRLETLDNSSGEMKLVGDSTVDPLLGPAVGGRALVEEVLKYS